VTLLAKVTVGVDHRCAARAGGRRADVDNRARRSWSTTPAAEHRHLHHHPVRARCGGPGHDATRIADGTEVENKPGAGNEGGQQILHSRVNVAMHPAGFAWVETTVAADSPSLAELALAGNWARVVERKAVPLAFLVPKL